MAHLTFTPSTDEITATRHVFVSTHVFAKAILDIEPKFTCCLLEQLVDNALNIMRNSGDDVPSGGVDSNSYAVCKSLWARHADLFLTDASAFDGTWSFLGNMFPMSALKPEWITPVMPTMGKVEGHKHKSQDMRIALANKILSLPDEQLDVTVYFYATYY